MNNEFQKRRDEEDEDYKPEIELSINMPLDEQSPGVYSQGRLSRPMRQGVDLDVICKKVRQHNTVRQFTGNCTYLCHHNILIVDDENMNLVLLYGLIASFGLHPIVCSSGE